MNYCPLIGLGLCNGLFQGAMKLFTFEKINKRRNYKGQAMLELAMTLPVFLALLFGVFEVCRLFFYNVSVNNASREAARYAATSGCPSSATCAAADTQYYEDCAGIQNRAISKSPGVGLTSSEITIQYDKGVIESTLLPNWYKSGSTILTCVNAPTLANGDRVYVRVEKPFQLIVPIPGLKSFSVVSETYRTYLGQVTY